MNKKITIAIDAMGGENAPYKNIEGLNIFINKNTKNKDRHRSVKYDLVLTIRNIKLHELY